MSKNRLQRQTSVVSSGGRSLLAKKQTSHSSIQESLLKTMNYTQVKKRGLNVDKSAGVRQQSMQKALERRQAR